VRLRARWQHSRREQGIARAIEPKFMCVQV
jgi:hypothetical protein